MIPEKELKTIFWHLGLGGFHFCYFQDKTLKKGQVHSLQRLVRCMFRSKNKQGHSFYVYSLNTTVAPQQCTVGSSKEHLFDRLYCYPHLKPPCNMGVAIVWRFYTPTSLLLQSRNKLIIQKQCSDHLLFLLSNHLPQYLHFHAIKCSMEVLLEGFYCRKC